MDKMERIYRTGVIEVEVSDHWLYDPEASGEEWAWADLRERIEFALARVVRPDSLEAPHVKVRFLEWDQQEAQQ